MDGETNFEFKKLKSYVKKEEFSKQHLLPSSAQVPASTQLLG